MDCESVPTDMDAVIDLVDDINQGFDIHDDYFEIFDNSADQKLYFQALYVIVTGCGMVCLTDK